MDNLIEEYKEKINNLLISNENCIQKIEKLENSEKNLKIKNENLEKQIKNLSENFENEIKEKNKLENKINEYKILLNNCLKILKLLKNNNFLNNNNNNFLIQNELITKLKNFFSLENLENINN